MHVFHGLKNKPFNYFDVYKRHVRDAKRFTQLNALTMAHAGAKPCSTKQHSTSLRAAQILQVSASLKKQLDRYFIAPNFIRFIRSELTELHELFAIETTKKNCSIKVNGALGNIFFRLFPFTLSSRGVRRVRPVRASHLKAI